MYRKRLKGVYELLEAGNNKKVIQEVDKLVAAASSSLNASKGRKPSSQEGVAGVDEVTTMTIAKALKSLALLRSGRKVDSDHLIDELLDSNTADENALSIIMQYCKETQQLSKIVSFYENAANKCQQNKPNTAEHEEILGSLFFAYVRNRDYVKQQQVAMKLYKQTNKMMYAYWNAASYILMSHFSHTSSSVSSSTMTAQQKDLYLQLAEKILLKSYDDKKMELDGEFLLLLNILETRKRHDQALTIVDSLQDSTDLSKIGKINFKFQKRTAYLKSLSKWPELRTACQEYFSEPKSSHIDDWPVYLIYFEALTEILKGSEQSQRDEIITQTQDFLQSLIKKIDNNEIKDNNQDVMNKIQGPYLARIQISQLLLKEKLVGADKRDSEDKKLKQHFKEYLEQFSSKPGFFYELIYFKELLEQPEFGRFVLDVLKSLYESNKNMPHGVKSVFTCLSYLTMQRHLGQQDTLSSGDLNKLADELDVMYQNVLANYGKDLPSTTFQYADDFAILAAHIRYQALQKQNDKAGVVKIVSLLKSALANSPSNFQIKLLLLNLYSQLGAYEPMQKMYESMEIKNIQHYSTGNLLLVHNIRLASLGSSSVTMSAMNHFFTSNLFDIANFLVNCYKYGTFLKAFELCEFMHSISKSLTMNLCLTNAMTTLIIQHGAGLEETVTGSKSATDIASSGADDDVQTETEIKTLRERLIKHLADLENMSGVLEASGEGCWRVNRDLLLDQFDKEAIYQWDSVADRLKAEKEYQKVIEEQKILFTTRFSINQLVSAVLSSSLSDNGQKPIQKLEFYRNQLVNDLFNSVKSEWKLSDSEEPLNQIYVTKSDYLKRFFNSELTQLLTSFIDLSIDLVKDTDGFLQSEQNNQQQKLTVYRDQIKHVCQEMPKKILGGLMDATFTDKVKIENLNKVIESVSVYQEAVSYAILLFVGSCMLNKSFRPVWNEKVKKSKKKKPLYLQYAQSVDMIYEMYESVCQLINYLHLSVKQAIAPRIDSNLMPDELAQSMNKSCDELKNHLNGKLKYMLKFSGNAASSQLATSLGDMKLSI